MTNLISDPLVVISIFFSGAAFGMLVAIASVEGVSRRDPNRRKRICAFARRHGTISTWAYELRVGLRTVFPEGEVGGVQRGGFDDLSVSHGRDAIRAGGHFAAMRDQHDRHLVLLSQRIE